MLRIHLRSVRSLYALGISSGDVAIGRCLNRTATPAGGAYAVSPHMRTGACTGLYLDTDATQL